MNLAALLGLDPEQFWQADALCAQTDPEAFYPEKGESTREAKQICASCEVRAECLTYALDNNERYGVWGGLSERERRRLTDRPRRQMAGTGHGGDHMCGRDGCAYRGATLVALQRHQSRYHPRAAA